MKDEITTWSARIEIIDIQLELRMYASQLAMIPV
jgi:hypothetical protein